MALYGMANKEVREMALEGIRNEAIVEEARRVADACQCGGYAPIDEPAPEPIRVDAWTAMFIVENERGRYRIDVCDVT